MSRGRFSILRDAELRNVHEASLTILRDTGVLVQHPEVVQMLVSAGARVESARPIVHLPETLVLESIARALTRSPIRLPAVLPAGASLAWRIRIPVPGCTSSRLNENG